jgi:hypothetical protein
MTNQERELYTVAWLPKHLPGDKDAVMLRMPGADVTIDIRQAWRLYEQLRVVLERGQR